MPEPLAFDELFDPAFLTQLQRFSLKTGRVAAGGRFAEQRSRARGVGIEFTDFKPYLPGDDLRHIDWNVYRRLGRVFVRVFEEYQDLPFYLLVDRSNSMYLESPPRISAGLRACLALTKIALQQHDSISIFSFSEKLEEHLKSTSGKHRLMPVAQRLVELSEQSSTRLSNALKQFALFNRRRGLLVIVSDFFETPFDSVLNALRLSRHRLLLVQLVKNLDADPTIRQDLQGEVRLVDCETGSGVNLTIEPGVLARYRAAYEEFNRKLIDFAQRHGAGLIRLNADRDVLEQLGEAFEASNYRV